MGDEIGLVDDVEGGHVTTVGPAAARAAAPSHPLLGQPLLVVLAWLVTRTWALLAGRGLVPYPQPEATLSDISLYLWWAPTLAAGQFPRDDMWQYPPAAGPLLGMLGPLLARGVPGVAAFQLLMLLADAFLLALLIGTGRRRRSGWDGMLPAWLWVIAVPLLGPIVFGRFDLVPAVLAAAGVLALSAAPRPGLAGVLLGVGALVKVWPAFAALAAPRRVFPRTLVSLIITGAAGTLLLAVGYGGIGGFLGNQAARGLQVESVAALPYLLARAAGADIEFPYRYGALEVAASGTDVAAVLATLVLLGGLGVLLLARVTGRLEDVPPGDIALTATLLSILGSRVFSPQFMVWVLALIAVAAVDPRTRLAGPMVLLAGCALATQLVYPWLYGPLLEGRWSGVGMQAGRIGLLIVATTWALVLVLRDPPPRSAAARCQGPQPVATPPVVVRPQATTSIAPPRTGLPCPSVPAAAHPPTG